jgi:prolyl-tRNA editing enzyme YbaK/EbsC (Cys-tRNA(Pro) deacylase)
MKMNLSPSAQKIQTHLDSLEYSCKVIEFQESTRTSADAAERVGCKVGQIVKSLIFKGRNSGKAILVLTSGVNRVDLKKLEALVHEPVDRADPEFVREVTGFAIGGIPPVGHASKIETYMDEDLFRYDTIWAAAGTPNAVFQVTPQDLITMTSAIITAVKEL